MLELIPFTLWFILKAVVLTFLALVVVVAVLNVIFWLGLRE